jgi:hypothetical protein
MPYFVIRPSKTLTPEMTAQAHPEVTTFPVTGKKSRVKSFAYSSARDLQYGAL